MGFIPHELASYTSLALLLYILLRWLPNMADQLRLIREDHVTRAQFLDVVQRLNLIEGALRELERQLDRHRKDDAAPRR